LNYNYNTANVILKENNRVQTRSTDGSKFQIKAAVGNHQTLSIMAVGSRPKPACDDWPLYGDEYGRMKLDNLPSKGYLLPLCERLSNLGMQSFM
jgi:hypothetical protein